MHLGLNQNITYNGQTYHVQTEDGGKKKPVVTTLLFKGGVILYSRRTEYADIIKTDGLEAIVKDIIRDQHREVIRDLAEGRLDDVLDEA